MDLRGVLSTYVDRALSRVGVFHGEWKLLILSVEEDLSEEKRWLRTKFGFGSNTEERVQVPSDTANVLVEWSPIAKFTGSVENVGAIIFVYEGTSEHARQMLSVVVQQTALQSRHKFPVLVINFNTISTNASEVFSSLGLAYNRLLEIWTCKHYLRINRWRPFKCSQLETWLKPIWKHQYGRLLDTSPQHRIQISLTPIKKRRNGNVALLDDRRLAHLTCLSPTVASAEASLHRSECGI